MNNNTSTRDAMPLAVAQADYDAANEAVKAIEEANAPLEDTLGALMEARENARQSQGDGSPDARTAEQRIADIHGKVMRARARLDAAKRRRDEAKRRLTSEQQAIAIARDAVLKQRLRVDRQRDACNAAQRVVDEKQTALRTELSTLEHFEQELSALMGEPINETA